MSVNEPLQPNYNFAWVKADNTRLTKEELHNQWRQDMSEKPKALRLAEALEGDYSITYQPYAAAELRRLHAENERLHDELRQSSIDITRAEVERLKAENERLREALTYDWDQLKACRESLREHMVEIKRLREALEKIATVNAMDYEYVRWAKAALRRKDL